MPPWRPASDDERRLADSARRLIDPSKAMQAEVARFRPMLEE